MRYVALLLVLVIILVPLVYYGLFYRPDPYNAQYSEVLYESPSDGEVVNLNYWYFGEVMIENPEPGLQNHYSFEFQILDSQEPRSPKQLPSNLPQFTTTFRKGGDDNVRFRRHGKPRQKQGDIVRVMLTICVQGDHATITQFLRIPYAGLNGCPCSG